MESQFLFSSSNFEVVEPLISVIPHDFNRIVTGIHHEEGGDILSLLYLEPHCLPEDNARNLRVNLKWWQGENFPAIDENPS